MFTLKLEEVNYEKIESFCKEQNPEGETIEYKRDFPSDLEKSISAMANTYGGIILIGVEADKTTNTPILPIKGRELEKGLEEKVTSICLRRIYHPYFPLVKVCPFKNEKGEDKCVVFIRVFESDQTPHAINNNTDVYFRIKSQNEPFRKATIDEIDWLKNKIGDKKLSRTEKY
jgi:predicted HTH transcriptional regulator